MSDLVDVLKARALDRRRRDIKMAGKANVGPLQGFFDWQVAAEIVRLRAHVADAEVLIAKFNSGEELQSIMKTNNDLGAEVADLTGANVLLHAIVSNREEEISDLRAQLALSEDRVSKLQAHPGERYWEGRWRDADRALASARKALKVTAAMIHGEMIENAVTDMSTMMTLGDVVQSALTDEKGQS